MATDAVKMTRRGESEASRCASSCFTVALQPGACLVRVKRQRRAARRWRASRQGAQRCTLKPTETLTFSPLFLKILQHDLIRTFKQCCSSITDLQLFLKPHYQKIFIF
jgi:hypothetical protein